MAPSGPAAPLFRMAAGMDAGDDIRAVRFNTEEQRIRKATEQRPLNAAVHARKLVGCLSNPQRQRIDSIEKAVAQASGTGIIPCLRFSQFLRCLGKK